MRTFDAELPWGCWLRLEPDGRRHAFVDDDGRSWKTFREAFWCGRLGMPLVNGEPPSEQMELMHAVLAARSRRSDGFDVETRDIFRGDRLYQDTYLCWLISHGLLAVQAVFLHPGQARIKPEGWAVLLMLDATRPTPVRQMRAGAPSIRELIEIARGPIVGEDRRRAVEEDAGRWEACFLRRDIGGRAAVILSRRGDGPVPVIRAVWTLTFPDVRDRDDFYDCCVTGSTVGRPGVRSPGMATRPG